MYRREFITLLGGAAAVYPLTVRAQQPARMSRIGWIAIGTPQGSEFLDAVREGLRQLDYVEGRSIIIEQRWPADIRDRVPELLRELLALNVRLSWRRERSCPSCAEQSTRLPWCSVIAAIRWRLGW